MRHFLPICLLLAVGTAFGQTFSFGAKAGYITYNRYYAEQTIEGTSVVASQRNPSYIFMDGLRYAVIARAEQKKWSGQAELAYAYHVGTGNLFLMDNWNNPSNVISGDYWLATNSVLLRQAELSVSGGYQLLKWIRLSVGLGMWYVQPIEPKKLIVHDETIGVEGVTKSYNVMNRIMYGIQESYLPWVLTRQLGIALEPIKNLSLEVVYDRNLTPVSKTLRYKDQNYAFRQRTDRFVVSVSYRLYRLGKARRESK